MQYFNTTLANKVPVDAYQVPNKLDDYPVWIQKLINSRTIVFDYKKDLVKQVQVQVANTMISVVPGYWIIKRCSGTKQGKDLTQRKYIILRWFIL